MFKVFLLSFLFSYPFIQAQSYPPEWSANGWNFSGWFGSNLDSSSTLTYVQDSSATQGSFSQLFSSGGQSQFHWSNSYVFSIYWRKSFPAYYNPISFIFDFNVNNIDSISAVHLVFTYGSTAGGWAVGIPITNNFLITEWNNVQVTVNNLPSSHPFNFIEFEMGFATSSTQLMHFAYLFDNLQLVYSDTTILIDGFGDDITDVNISLSGLIDKEYLLNQNYPNPFNPVTKISYQISEQGLVQLKVYDILGNEVVVLVNEVKSEGIYSVNFDASNLPSGVYIYSLRVNDFIQNKKMTLLK